ncbi:MAG: hypothetical protein KKF44_08710 [Nanoarchaeota archaeon]|nr:hypothetical protein [Nanoarchaeota archaeon]
MWHSQYALELSDIVALAHMSLGKKKNSNSFMILANSPELLVKKVVAAYRARQILCNLSPIEVIDPEIETMTNHYVNDRKNGEKGYHPSLYRPLDRLFDDKIYPAMSR